MRARATLLLGLAAALAGPGCNLIADIQEGVLIGAAGSGGVAGSGAAGGSGGGAAGGSGGGAAGGSTSQGGGATCAEPAPSDACAACLFQGCQEEYCGCAGNADCVGLFNCTAEGKPIELCWQSNVEGISAAGRLQACGAELCPDCGFAPVGECLACQYTSCAEAVNACFSSSECYGFLECFDECVATGGAGPRCSAMCSSQFTQGVPLAQALVECQDSSCSVPCGP